jgi:pimeloyl-ACP methyl ester carboxylesterase
MIFLNIAIVLIILSIVIGYIIIRNFSKPLGRHFSKFNDEGIKLEEVSIPTEKNKKLFGWWIEAKTKAPTIILMHGWDRNISKLIPYIKNLNGRGFNMLAFDTRHHGNSDSDNFSSIVKFAQDISASITFVENKPTVEKNNFFLIGHSIGGAASIYAAAADYRIKKIVTIGAPSNPSQIMTMQMRKKHIPQPIIWAAFKIMEIRIGKRFTQLASATNISKIKAKVLLIHGTNDKIVPFTQANIILDAANNNQAELWAITGKGHSNCHSEIGFWDRIIEFLR